MAWKNNQAINGQIYGVEIHPLSGFVATNTFAVERLDNQSFEDITFINF